MPAIRVHDNLQCQIIVWFIDFLDHLIVKCRDGDDPRIRFSGLNHFLLQCRDIAAEKVPGADMHPSGRSLGPPAQFIIIKVREPDPDFFPFRLIPDAFSVQCWHDLLLQ
jgi:hypothetical protein